LKFNGAVLGVWAAINSKGKTDLYFYEGRLNSVTYQEILKKAETQLNALLPTNNHIFMQDGASCHTSHSTQEFLEDECKYDFWDKTEWPGNSPDLNPLENVWAYLDSKVKARMPGNKEDFKRKLKEEWAKITPDTLRKFVSSMPRRIQAVLDADGKHTKY
jgi:transposase